MNSVKFSIIIPVYNAEKYIDKCIKSVFEQKYENVEIIAIDDGSSDKSLERLKQYKDKIELIEQKNHGVSYSRNIGIEKATGDWLIFLDADDELLCGSLNYLSETIKDASIDYIITNVISEMPNELQLQFFKRKITDKNELINSIVSINYSKEKNFFSNNSRCIGGKIFKREIVKKYKIKFDTELNTFEDGFFNMEYINYCEDIYFLNTSIYYYRNVKTSKTHSIDEKNTSQIHAIVTKMQSTLKRMSGYNYNEEVFGYFMVDMYRILCGNIVKSCKLNLYKAIKLIKEEYKKLFGDKFYFININELSSKKEKFLIKIIKKKNFFLIYLLYFLK